MILRELIRILNAAPSDLHELPVGVLVKGSPRPIGMIFLIPRAVPGTLPAGTFVTVGMGDAGEDSGGYIITSAEAAPLPPPRCARCRDKERVWEDSKDPDSPMIPCPACQFIRLAEETNDPRR